MPNKKQTYQATFTRFHSKTKVEEKRVIVITTSRPFNAKNLDKFIALFWSKLRSELPEWMCGLPLVDGIGWSNADLKNGRITKGK